MTAHGSRATSRPIAPTSDSVTVLTMTSPVPNRLLAGLNPEQVAAVMHRGGPLLVVAGPGSGKTRVLTHRLASLVEDGIAPERILAVTFTNKAAAEMRHRLASLLPAGVEVPASVSTFHSFCVRALRAHAADLSLPRNFSVLDADDALRAFTSANESLEKEDAKAAYSAISFAKNALQTPADLAASPLPALRAAARAWESYAQRMRELGALDFDDLLLYTRELLTTHAGDALRNRFDSILVDEWQDTNLVQYDIVKLLAGENFSTRDVVVVGDPEQAIYGWRGSTPEVVDRFVSDFSPCRVIELGHNYRSSARIVAVSAAVAAASRSATKATLRTDNPAGDLVRVVSYHDTDHEAKEVVSTLAKLSSTRAVLVRTKAQTRAFEKELIKARIPFNLVGASPFSARAEVKDAVAYLRLLLNPSAEFDLRRAASVPRRKLGAAALDAFLTAARTADLAPGVALHDPSILATLPARSRTGLESFAETMAALHDLAPSGPAACVRFVLDSGLRDFHSSDQDRLQNLDELLAEAISLEADLQAMPNPPSGPEMLERFVENLSLASGSDAKEPSQVSVITAHASKGREFDHVWVVGAEELMFPHSMADTPAEVEEERRLFFVAVSRARLGLTVSYRRRHFVYGEWSDADPSRFIELLEPLSTGPSPAVHFDHRPRPDDFSGRFYPGAKPRPRAPRSAYTPIPVARQASTSAPASALPEPTPRLDPALAQVGLTVSHSVFGLGRILSIAGTAASIDFSGKVRTLDLSFAPLTLG